MLRWLRWWVSGGDVERIRKVKLKVNEESFGMVSGGDLERIRKVKLNVNGGSFGMVSGGDVERIRKEKLECRKLWYGVRRWENFRTMQWGLSLN
nr:hypothetical protein BgiMline_028012 [Biomphalaria glabrata]